MKDTIKFVLSIIQTLALVLIAILLFRMGKAPELKQIRTSLEAHKKNSIPIELTKYDAIWGSNNAAYTIVAYIDYECPFCKDFYRSLKEIEAEYIQSGKVKVILRDMPIRTHKNARKLAAVAECARIQGKFWNFANLALSNEKRISDSLLFSWGQQIGLDREKLSSCMDDTQTNAVIEEDIRDAHLRELAGTPAIYINDNYHRGTISGPNLKLIFEGKKPQKSKGSGSCK